MAAFTATPALPWDEFVASIKSSVSWKDKRLSRITHLRLRRTVEPSKLAVDYCYGQLMSGDRVFVLLPFTELSTNDYKGDIIRAAKRACCYAANLNIFHAISVGF